MRAGGEAGYSLGEMLISMGIMTAVMGATATVMNQAMRASESAVMVSGLNNSLRTGMDLMIRDMLQVGSGLPTGHVVLIPSGTNAQRMNIPGPPGTAFQTVVGDLDWAAVVPGNGLGPTINGVATDVITVLMADNNFIDMPLTAITNTTIDVRATNPATGQAINIQTGVDRVLAGQLLMLEKGSDHDAGANHQRRLLEPAHHVRQRRLVEAESDGGSGRQRRCAPRCGAAGHADERRRSRRRRRASG